MYRIFSWCHFNTSSELLFMICIRILTSSHFSPVCRTETSSLHNVCWCSSNKGSCSNAYTETGRTWCAICKQTLKCISTNCSCKHSFESGIWMIRVVLESIIQGFKEAYMYYIWRSLYIYIYILLLYRYPVSICHIQFFNNSYRSSIIY